MQNTLRFWAAYWYLRDHCGYSDTELAANAEEMSKEKKLPYEICFDIIVYCLPRTTVAS